MLTLRFLVPPFERMGRLAEYEPALMPLLFTRTVTDCDELVMEPDLGDAVKTQSLPSL